MAAGADQDGKVGVGRRSRKGARADDIGVAASESNSPHTEEEVVVAEPPAKDASLEVDADHHSADEAAIEESTEEQDTLAKEKALALARLQELCYVLGYNFKTKLNEFGTGEVEIGMVRDMIRFHEESRQVNFNKLQEIAGNLLIEWELGDTPFKRMEKFSWILAIWDAATVNQVILPGALSTDNVNRADKELELLQKERVEKEIQKYKIKYQMRKKNLVKMLSEAHLRGSDFNFDSSKKVRVEEYKMEAKDLKAIKKTVKLAIPDRKQMVLRVELLKKSVQQGKPLQHVIALYEQARDAARTLSELRDETVSYDGQMIEELLNSLLQTAEEAAAAPGDVQQEAPAPTTRTRARSKVT